MELDYCTWIVFLLTKAWVTVTCQNFYSKIPPQHVKRKVKQIKADSHLSNYHLKHFNSGMCVSIFTSISILFPSTAEDTKSNIEWP